MKTYVKVIIGVVVAVLLLVIAARLNFLSGLGIEFINLRTEKLQEIGCTATKTCGAYTFLDCGIETDGPGLYVHISTGLVVGHEAGMTSNGPSVRKPKGWTCE